MKDAKFVAWLIAGLFVVIVLLAWRAERRMKAEEAACQARGGVLAQTRAPPYVCVEPQ